MAMTRYGSRQRFATRNERRLCKCCVESGGRAAVVPCSFRDVAADSGSPLSRERLWSSNKVTTRRPTTAIDVELILFPGMHQLASVVIFLALTWHRAALSLQIPQIRFLNPVHVANASVLLQEGIA